jgi:uncharacterized protein (TIGR03435 family)
VISADAVRPSGGTNFSATPVTVNAIPLANCVIWFILGLRLETEKLPVEFLIVDRVEKPIDN